METHMWCLSLDSVGEVFIKGIVAFASTSVWEKAAPLPPSHFRPDVRQFTSSLYVSGAFQDAVSVLELRRNKYE